MPSQSFTAYNVLPWRGDATTGDGVAFGAATVQPANPNAGVAFGGAQTPVLIQGNAAGTDATLVAPPQNVPNPPPSNLLPGAITALNAYTRTAFRANVAPFMPGAPPTREVALQFALFDPVRGARMSDLIRWDRTTIVKQTPYQPIINHSVIFNCAYSSVVAAHNTFQGQILTVKVHVDRDIWERDKHPIIASVNVPGFSPPNQPPIPATNQQIQIAHFALLEALLAADSTTDPNAVNGYYFDHFWSRTLSMATNYSQIVLVGNLRRVYFSDLYSAYAPIKLDVALIEGFGLNPLYERPDSTVPGYVAATIANTSYISTFSNADPGSGNPDQVAWHEAQHIGQEGHRNHILYPQPRRISPVNNIFFDCVDIEYYNQIKLVGENQDKELYKHLTIYYNRGLAGPVLPFTPATSTDGILALPAMPAGQYNLANVFDGAAGRPVYINPGPMPQAPPQILVNANNTIGPLNRDYVLPVVPAQSANAALFASDNLIAPSFIGNAFANIMP